MPFLSQHWLVILSFLHLILVPEFPLFLLDIIFSFAPKLSTSRSWILLKFDSMKDSEPFISISLVK